MSWVTSLGFLLLNTARSNDIAFQKFQKMEESYGQANQAADLGASQAFQNAGIGSKGKNLLDTKKTGNQTDYGNSLIAKGAQTAFDLDKLNAQQLFVDANRDQLEKQISDDFQRRKNNPLG